MVLYFRKNNLKFRRYHMNFNIKIFGYYILLFYNRMKFVRRCPQPHLYHRIMSTHTHTHTHTQPHTHTYRSTLANIPTQTNTYPLTYTDSSIQTHTHTEAQKHRQTHLHTDGHSLTHTDTPVNCYMRT